MSKIQRRTLVALAAGALLGSPMLAAAQAYPSQPVRLVVPYAAGGGTDVLARKVAKAAEEHLGQTIVIDNKPGAGTTIAATDVANAKPDGYTILWGDNATYAVNPHVYRKLNYDPMTSFAPVTLAIRGVLALSVSTQLPVKTVPEFIAYAKKNPEKLSYGTPGNGTPHHLAMESLKRATGISIQHVPYKGEAPAMQDLIPGTIDVMFSGVRLARAQIDGGRVLTLAVSGPKRNAVVPEIPTLDEAGLKGFSYQYWHGIVAPAQTPPEVVARLNDAFVKALNSAEISHWLRTVPGAEPAASTPDEMKAHMTSELKSAGELVKAINLRMD